MISPALAKPERILLVALDNLGDLVFTSALTGPLREAFPRATIDVWAKAYTADIARLIPHVGTVIAADPPWAVHPQRGRPPLGDFLRSMREVRRGRYDVALLAGAPWRLAAAVALTGIPVRIGGLRRHNQRFLTHAVAPDDPRVLVVEDQQRLLAPLGITPTQSRATLDPARLGARLTTVASALPDRFVALHPFAAVAEKRAPLDEWIRLGATLAERGVPLLWCGTSAELKSVRLRDHPAGVYVDELGDGTLADTAAALSLAHLFIGHDSGPLHVAAAFGVPVVDVFVGGNPDRYGPQGTGRSRILRAASPAEITSDAMFGALESLGLFSAT